MAGVQRSWLNPFLNILVTQLETCSGTCHAWMSNCSILLRIYLLLLWVKSNTNSSCEISLFINGFPQHLASSPKSSPWPQGAACLPRPRPHLLDSSPAPNPWASLLLLEHIKPASTSGPFLWLFFLSRTLYFWAATWLIHLSFCSPHQKGLP